MSGQLSIFDQPRRLEVIHGDTLTKDEERVLRVLEAHKGHGNAITGEKMAEMLQMDKDRPRQVVRHLREFHKMLIGATNVKPQGYFLIATPEDKELADRNKRTRALTMLSDLAKEKNMTLEEVFHQGKLELEASVK